MISMMPNIGYHTSGSDIAFDANVYSLLPFLNKYLLYDDEKQISLMAKHNSTLPETIFHYA